MLPEWDDRKVEKRMNINREEILALTRRMTVKRTSMTKSQDAMQTQKVLLTEHLT